jgi:hypothetical protein
MLVSNFLSSQSNLDAVKVADISEVRDCSSVAFSWRSGCSRSLTSIWNM